MTLSEQDGGRRDFAVLAERRLEEGELAGSKLGALLAYWASCRQGQALPSRGAIRPEQMRSMIGLVNLFDVEQAPLRFRTRLHGSHNAAALAGDLTDRYLDELEPPDYRALILPHFAEAVQRREPVAHYIGVRDGWRIWDYARVLLPLADDGRQVNMVLSGAVCEAELSALLDSLGLASVRP